MRRKGRLVIQAKNRSGCSARKFYIFDPAFAVLFGSDNPIATSCEQKAVPLVFLTLLSFTQVYFLALPSKPPIWEDATCLSILI